MWSHCLDLIVFHRFGKKPSFILGPHKLAATIYSDSKQYHSLKSHQSKISPNTSWSRRQSAIVRWHGIGARLFLCFWLMMYTDSSLNKEWQKLIKDPGCMHSTLLATGNSIVKSNKSFFLRRAIKDRSRSKCKVTSRNGIFFYFKRFCWLWRQLLKQDKRANQSKYYIK